MLFIAAFFALNTSGVQASGFREEVSTGNRELLGRVLDLG